MLSIMLFVFAGLAAVGTVATIVRVDKPRQPITPVEAAVTTVYSAGVITVYILAALALS